MEPEDYLIWLYLKVEELFSCVVKEQRLRSRGFSPRLSDVEMLTNRAVQRISGVR